MNEDTTSSPYNRSQLPTGRLSNWQHLAYASYWFATNFHWGALLFLVIPDDIERISPMNRAQVLGLVTGLGSLAALLVPLISGALSDRCAHPWGRRRPFIAVGVLINLLALAAMAAIVEMALPRTTTLILYTVVFLFVQTGNNIASGAYMGVIPDMVPITERGKASGFMALLSQLGTISGIVICGAVLDGQANYLKYATVLGVLLIVSIITLVFVKETPIAKPKDSFDWRKYLKSLWIDPKKYPDFAWVWITRFLVMMGFYAIMPFIKYYLVDVVKVPREEVNKVAPVLIFVILLVAAISGVLGGTVSDKIGRKKVVYLSNSLIAIISLSFVMATSVPQALLVGAIFGFGYGAYISVDYALGTDVLPNQEEAGKDMAVWHIAMTLPQSFMGPIAGYLIALPGAKELPPSKAFPDGNIMYTQAGYVMVFVMCSICFALGAILLRNVKGVR